MVSRVLNEQRSHTISRASTRQAKLRQHLPKIAPPSSKRSHLSKKSTIVPESRAETAPVETIEHTLELKDVLQEVLEPKPQLDDAITYVSDETHPERTIDQDLYKDPKLEIELEFMAK